MVIFTLCSFFKVARIPFSWGLQTNPLWIWRMRATFPTVLSYYNNIGWSTEIKMLRIKYFFQFTLSFPQISSKYQYAVHKLRIPP